MLTDRMDTEIMLMFFEDRNGKWAKLHVGSQHLITKIMLHAVSVIEADTWTIKKNFMAKEICVDGSAPFGELLYKEGKIFAMKALNGFYCGDVGLDHCQYPTNLGMP